MNKHLIIKLVSLKWEEGVIRLVLGMIFTK